MAKKELKPDDVKEEDIDRVIQKSFYDIDESKGKAFLKLFTFILMFAFYIYISIIVQAYTLKLMVIVFGIVFLTFIFQDVVVPAFKIKRKAF